MSTCRKTGFKKCKNKKLYSHGLNNFVKLLALADRTHEEMSACFSIYLLALSFFRPVNLTLIYFIFWTAVVILTSSIVDGYEDRIYLFLFKFFILLEITIQ